MSEDSYSACAHTGPDGFACERPRDHPGKHAAFINDDERETVEWIGIPMNEWSQGRLREGEKSATTRTERYGERGDRFEAVGRVYELTDVIPAPLRLVAVHFHEEEGCESKEEFIEVWEDIHYRKGYKPDWMVYLHLFRGVDDE